MNRKLTLGLALVLGGGLFGCSTSGPHPAVSHAGARQHFADYLNQCADDEIRCLWFLQDDPRTGMVMTIHLNAKTADTVKDAYDLPAPTAATHALEDYEASKLRQIISRLPPSDKTGQYGSSVFVSIRAGGITRVFQYDRHYPPPAVRQIYNLGGGYFYGDDGE